VLDNEKVAVYDYYNGLFIKGYSVEECATLTAKKFKFEFNEVHNAVNRVLAILFLKGIHLLSNHCGSFLVLNFKGGMKWGMRI